MYAPKERLEGCKLNCSTIVSNRAKLVHDGIGEPTIAVVYRSLAAAMVLGAQGVMMASRFIATQECEVHEAIKQELVKRQENDTVLYGQATGLQGRGLKNKIISEIMEVEKQGGGLDELIPLMSGLRVKEAWVSGDVESAPLMVGQSIGLIRDIPNCQELLDRMGKEAAEYLNKAKNMIH